MIYLLLIVGAVFAVAFLLRVGGARRVALMRKWPSMVLAAAALLLLARGAWQPAAMLAGGAWLAWLLWPPRPRRLDQDADTDRDARATLGVGANASDAEIRNAFRDRMRTAHPDRGGSHAQAARMVAARDRLLRRGRG